MNIIKTSIAPMIMGTAMTLSSCDSTVSKTVQSRKQVLTEVMADKPAKDYDKIVADLGKGMYVSDVKAQSSLDSVAYRDLFDGTRLAKDSSKVKAFNAIAHTARPDVTDAPKDVSNFENISNLQDKKIKDLGISKKGFDASQNEYAKIGSYHSNGIAGSRWEPNYSKIVATRQYKADSLAYENFFRENKILTDSVKKEIKKIAKIVKP